MRYWLVIVISFILMGGLAFSMSSCGAPPTEVELEERAYRAQEKRERWIICAKLYEDAGVPTIHRHHHDSRRDNDADIQDDLHINQCRHILKQAGIWQ